jgi:hypothetical protein
MVFIKDNGRYFATPGAIATTSNSEYVELTDSEVYRWLSQYATTVK